ncbi:Rho GTPase activation protein [Arabidopsis suecica]|uniref:Rho GTPase activation protein n=1 Tax=Arabidopsis suecica TaxID=45249 RepID=A0A8T1ZCW8_ARASU|nr:Rho GTPase activation protein [Arabidopsis suecica]
MTEVLHFPSSPSASPSSSSSSASPSSLSYASRSNASLLISSDHNRRNPVPGFDQDVDFHGSIEERSGNVGEEDDGREDQISLLALLVAIFRRSLISCKSNRRELCSMEIGWPTNIRHVAHVTFDRFNGFLGLPVEFEPEVPRRAPSASATVFGVSTESMQLSYDSRGNCVPTILLLMQNCLYSQGGLQAEGIFRLTAENSEEEAVREQLNRGFIPERIDVHCLAGLIKAWFRELPTSVLDSLSPEQVMQCQTEEENVELVRLLPPTEAALLDWAINLMADVVQYEHLNKMNSRNIAMVFAPNMTQMDDPLTALMYAVQVMNFLKTLIEKTLRERQDSVVEQAHVFPLQPSDESGHQSPSQSLAFNTIEQSEETQSDNIENAENQSSSSEISDELTLENNACEQRESDSGKCRTRGLSDSGLQLLTLAPPAQWPVGRTKGLTNLSRVGSRVERTEAWR